MKKKIFFGVATLFFAVATMFNLSMLQGRSAGDVSLESIAVMAQAMSGEEFYELTGCYASWDYGPCTGKDGRTYTYASSTKP